GWGRALEGVWVGAGGLGATGGAGISERPTRDTCLAGGGGGPAGCPAGHWRREWVEIPESAARQRATGIGRRRPHERSQPVTTHTCSGAAAIAFGDERRWILWTRLVRGSNSSHPELLRVGTPNLPVPSDTPPSGPPHPSD